MSVLVSVGTTCLRNLLPERQLELEARVGIEPTNGAFAEPCLTTWLPRLPGTGSVPDPPPSVQGEVWGPRHVELRQNDCYPAGGGWEGWKHTLRQKSCYRGWSGRNDEREDSAGRVEQTAAAV